MTYVEKAVEVFKQKREKFYKGQLERDMLAFDKAMTRMQKGGTCIGCIVQCVECPVRMYIQNGHKTLQCGTLEPAERARIIQEEIKEPEEEKPKGFLNAQDTHMWIWGYVIDHCASDKSISELKEEARRQLLMEGLISAKAGVYLELHQNCVMCVLYGNKCNLCPLKHCAGYGALFAKAVAGDRDAMEYIKNTDVLENAEAIKPERLKIMNGEV